MEPDTTRRLIAEGIALPVNDNRFVLGTPDSFVLLVDRVHLSVLHGIPCHVEPFESQKLERQWLVWQLNFQRQVLERLERYVELRLAELDAPKSEPPEGAHGDTERLAYLIDFINAGGRPVLDCHPQGPRAQLDEMIDNKIKPPEDIP